MSDEINSVESEILQYVNSWVFNVPDRDKDFRAYRKWLAEEADKLEDDEWEVLSEEAQEWLNYAWIALNNEHWPPNFNDPYEKTESIQNAKVLRPEVKYKKNSTIVRLREIFATYGMNIDYDSASILLAKYGLEIGESSFHVQKSYFKGTVNALEKMGYLEPGVVPLYRVPEKQDMKKLRDGEDN